MTMTAILRQVGFSLSLSLAVVGSYASFSPPAGADTALAPSEFAQKLAAAAMERTRHRVIYDPAYRAIAYPGGDVALDRGVCTDVVIRSFRALGIDLQKRVHVDMRAAFRAYPNRWGLKRPDTNIDHRRVPNLRRFFIRHGQSLPISLNGDDYKVGDLVTWDLGASKAGLHPITMKHPNRLANSRKPHIGIVSARRSADGRRPLIVHNIGGGTELSDMLFDFQITGRYRYPARHSR